MLRYATSRRCKARSVASWVALLQHCTRARGAKPGQKWSKQAEAALKKIERPALEKSLVRWFPLVEKPRTRPVERGSQWQPDPNMLLQNENADILKALAWLCAGSRERRSRSCLGRPGALGLSQSAADGAEVCQAWQRLRVGVGRYA